MREEELYRDRERESEREMRVVHREAMSCPHTGDDGVRGSWALGLECVWGLGGSLLRICV